VKNTSFIFITYDPSTNAFLMFTIDLFLTIVQSMSSIATVSPDCGSVPIRTKD
jgi:hypothetical protein